MHNGKHFEKIGSHVGDSSELFGQRHKKPNCKELALSYIQSALGSKFLRFQYFQERCVTHYTPPTAMRGLYNFGQ